MGMNARFLTGALQKAQGGECAGTGARLLEGFKQAFENIVTQDKPLATVVDEIQVLLNEARQIDDQASLAIIWKAVVDRGVGWAVETQTPENLGIFLNRLVEQNPDRAGVILGRASQVADNLGEDIRNAVCEVSLGNQKQFSSNNPEVVWL
jgi:hypothetical protein